MFVDDMDSVFFGIFCSRKCGAAAKLSIQSKVITDVQQWKVLLIRHSCQTFLQVVQLKILPLRPDHWQFPGPAPFSAVLALLSKRQKEVKEVFNSIFHSSGGSIYTF
jgi:hypothetical protein